MGEVICKLCTGKAFCVSVLGAQWIQNIHTQRTYLCICQISLIISTIFSNNRSFSLMILYESQSSHFPNGNTDKKRNRIVWFH